MPDLSHIPTRLLPRTTLPSVYGCDYGVSAYSAVVVDTSFVEVLREANVYGCGYGEQLLKDGGGLGRILWLVGEKEASLRQAFDIFRSWAIGTDDDALSLQIILLDSGGYLLLLGPDPDRAQIRIAGYGSSLRPLIYSATYAKRMDTTSPFVIELQRYVKQAISPVMFGAAIAPRQLGGEPKLLEDCPELLLYKIAVYSESEARLNPSLKHFVERVYGTDRPEDERLKRPEPPSTQAVSKRRVTMIKNFFPVTRFRVQHEKRFYVLTEGLLAQGVRPWQVEQALCNLQLTGDIRANVVQEGGAPPIWTALSSRFEDLQTILVEPHLFQIKDQLLADAQQLLRAIVPDEEPKATFYECAGELAHLGFLDV